MADLDDLNDRPPVVAALTYASRGWPVFPVAWALEGTCACRLGPGCTHPAKHPLVPGGTASATTDLALVRSWWAHWPLAGIGLLTGSRSGLAVLDIDPGHDGAGTLSALGPQGIVVPPTLCADTGGGGQHYFFAIGGPGAVRVPNTSGRLPGRGSTPGIDIRGQGGYVVAAPSLHRSGRRYAWRPTASALAPLPVWMTRPAPPRERGHPVPVARPGTANRYAAEVVRREVAAVAAAPQGQRSDQLNHSAFALGTLVGAGALAETDVMADLLRTATHVGLTATEASRTIRSGLRAGMARPRRLPSTVEG